MIPFHQVPVLRLIILSAEWERESVEKSIPNWSEHQLMFRGSREPNPDASQVIRVDGNRAVGKWCFNPFFRVMGPSFPVSLTDGRTAIVAMFTKSWRKMATQCAPMGTRAGAKREGGGDGRGVWRVSSVTLHASLEVLTIDCCCQPTRLPNPTPYVGLKAISLLAFHWVHIATNTANLAPFLHSLFSFIDSFVLCCTPFFFLSALIVWHRKLKAWQVLQPLH